MTLPPDYGTTLMLPPGHRFIGVSPVLVRVLEAADEMPRSAHALHGPGGGVGLKAQMVALCRAGFLRPVESQCRRRMEYAITPAGIEFRQYLRRLEWALEGSL